MGKVPSKTDEFIGAVVSGITECPDHVIIEFKEMSKFICIRNYRIEVISMKPRT